MLRSVAFASAFAVVLAASASSAQAATVLSVGPNPDCGEGGCFQDKLTYTQTFAAGTFGHGASISGLKIDKGLLGDMQNYVLKVSFMRADGTLVSDWGGWVLAVVGGKVVTVSGPDFDWNSDLGDLTLKFDLVVPGKGGGWGPGGRFGGGGFSGGGFGGGPPASPAPQFVTAPQAPALTEAVLSVPEPATWALMVGGFGGAGALLRRRRRLAAAHA